MLRYEKASCIMTDYRHLTWCGRLTENQKQQLSIRHAVFFLQIFGSGFREARVQRKGPKN